MCAPEGRAAHSTAARRQGDAAGRWPPTDVRWREHDLEAVFSRAYYPERCGVHLPWRTLGAQFEPLELNAPSAAFASPAQYERVQANLYQPPFADGAFAATVAYSLLDVLPEPHAALLRLERLLTRVGCC